ncbi:MAG: winged helix-turn-helix domain-containing protein [Actinomycetota bacterium]
MTVLRRIDVATARRLAIAKQRLAGPTPLSSPARVLDVIRSIRCVQLDPISVVARSPLLVLRSRFDGFQPKHLDRLLYRDRSLFEYWAHAASIVLSEDYPIFRYRMRSWPGTEAWGERVRGWIQSNAKLRRSVLTELRRRGPLRLRDFPDDSVESWESSGWTRDRNVDQMVRFLWIQGKVMVADRNGLEKWWDLAERVLPDAVRRERMTDAQVARRAIELSLRCLGVGTAAHVRGHFTHGYPGLPEILRGFERSGLVDRVEVVDDGAARPGTWYVHREDLPLLERIERGRWEPRTTMLSPFDNLMHDRKRLLDLFGLDYKMEIYVAAVKRRHGYYSMPVLHGDRFLARVDPANDRENSRLIVRHVVPEPGVKADAANTGAVSNAVHDLAAWLGAERVDVDRSVPPAWRRALG